MIKNKVSELKYYWIKKVKILVLVMLFSIILSNMQYVSGMAKEEKEKQKTDSA